jgi:hypothetical protein
MAVFSKHKIGVNSLLNFIPETLLTNLSLTTKVDYYSKILHGKKMFYLLLYGILENEKLSQRTLEDTFNDSIFKLLFNLDENEKIRRSSISERLSVIKPDYFKQIYECIYDQFSDLYTLNEIKKHNLIRVDSSMVSEGVGRLMEGLDNNSCKKAVKYSVAFDGLLPCQSEVFTASKYSSEDIALPEAVLQHVKKDSNHQNIYVLDRGFQSCKTMKKFSKNTIQFICRAKEKRKHLELSSLLTEDQDLDIGESVIIKDSKVNLYTSSTTLNKKGKPYNKSELLKEEFRLIVIRNKAGAQNEYHFLTNNFELFNKRNCRSL